MAGKLSMGSNHSTLNNVTVDTGVKGMQGKATEKLQYWLQKKQTKKKKKKKKKYKHQIKSHLKKKI